MLSNSCQHFFWYLAPCPHLDIVRHTPHTPGSNLPKAETNIN